MGLVLLAPSLASAQPLESFHDLALRTNLGDRLQIEDQFGARITGRLTRLTRDEITMQAGDGEKRLTSAMVREVAVRRRPRREGVLIGAAVGAGLAAVAACGGPDRSECADGPILAGALGAGVGLAVSALFPRTTVVYRQPMDAARSRGSAPPSGPFDDLALRVNLDDRLRVEDQSGVRTTGRLTRLAGNDLTLETEAGEKRFASASVREVAVRRDSLGKGAAIGAGAFAVLALAAPACRSNPDCSPIGAAAVGAGAGLAVGALIPQMKTVFRMPEKRATFSVEISRRGVGIRGSVGW